VVKAIHTVGKASGGVPCEISEQGAESRVFRRLLLVVRDMKAGEVVTAENVRSIYW